MGENLGVEKMASLATDIRDIWKDNEQEFETMLGNWLNRLEDGENIIRKAKKQFHQWHPLRIYTSVTKSTSNLFSLRFYGQEVAELSVEEKNVILRLNRERKHYQKNLKWFEGCPLKNGDYDWNSKEAREFRAFFKQKADSSKGMPRVKSIEHRIESKFIEEMLGPSGKFGISDLRIQPVTIPIRRKGSRIGVPLQFPVPISANTGRPKKNTGYIDILARRLGKNHRTRLSVWEPKSPKVYGKPVSQVYIYAYQILHILRHTKNASRWYRLFGFENKIPDRLEIEAVVAVNRKHEKELHNELVRLKKSTSFAINGDCIKLYAAYYNEESNSITLENNPFRESL